MDHPVGLECYLNDLHRDADFIGGPACDEEIALIHWILNELHHVQYVNSVHVVCVYSSMDHECTVLLLRIEDRFQEV